MMIWLSLNRFFDSAAATLFPSVIHVMLINSLNPECIEPSFFKNSLAVSVLSSRKSVGTSIFLLVRNSCQDVLHPSARDNETQDVFPSASTVLLISSRVLWSYSILLVSSLNPRYITAKHHFKTNKKKFQPPKLSSMPNCWVGHDSNLDHGMWETISFQGIDRFIGKKFVDLYMCLKYRFFGRHFLMNT